MFDKIVITQYVR